MECEEKRSGSKKRSKLIQVGRDSDDDEPIGSLFKVKGKRNPKKVKTGSEGDGEKGQDVEVRGENLEVVDEDLGVMNDTLASFKKKLKGPKKDSGSGKATGRRTLGIIVTEPSSLNGPVKDGGLTMETKIVENGKVIGEDGSDGSMSKELGNRVKEKTKRSKSASKRKKTALAGQGFLDGSIQNHTEYVLGSGQGPNHCLNDNLEDSLSTLFQKAQSDLSRKSRMRSRQRRETQAPKNRLNSDDVSDGIPPVFLGRYRSASNLALEFSHRDDSFCLVSGRIPIDSDHCQNKIGIRQSSDESMQKSLSSSDAMLERSSTRVVTDLNMQSRDNMHGVPEAALEESVPTSFSQRSQSYLTVCSSKTARREEGYSNHLQDGDSEQFLSVKVKDESSEPTTEIKNVKGIFRAIDSGHDFVEIPDSIPVPVQKEETHLLEAVLPNADSNHPADQQCKSGLSPLSFCVVHKSEFGIPIKREEKSTKTGDNSNLSPPEHCLNESVTPDLICRPSVHHSQPFDDVPKDTCVQTMIIFQAYMEKGNRSLLLLHPSTPDRLRRKDRQPRMAERVHQRSSVREGLNNAGMPFIHVQFLAYEQGIGVPLYLGCQCFYHSLLEQIVMLFIPWNKWSAWHLLVGSTCVLDGVSRLEAELCGPVFEKRLNNTGQEADSLYKTRRCSTNCLVYE
ncbi:LSD1-like 3 [Actinidia rufa]|uniref:LSD1-like 3 n=1 Tax=Actinidia rufa TaxID=165716 RepID=A0A7J0GI42_9ERIC|nr:LSD1-like 3 [Actinidia rufa]